MEVAACADYVMKAMGADRVGISTIVCSGWRHQMLSEELLTKLLKKGT